MVVPTKIFIGNLPEDGPREEMKEQLKKDLESYGELAEFDIVLNYGFAHFKENEDAKKAVQGLNGNYFFGKRLRVELSTSRVRHKPGMGSKQECFRCGGEGHWSKTCPQYPKGNNYHEDEDYPDPANYRRGSYDRNPREDYYRERYAPPASLDRYRPYPSLYDRRALLPPAPPAPQDLYPKDPYTRPPPEYYEARRLPVDPLELYIAQTYGRPPVLPRSAGREISPPPMPSSRPSYPPREWPY